jgi:sialic acid synthase SpsE
MTPYIIAELGGIAKGHLPTMLRQIDSCAEAGVSAVKAQWLSDPQRLVRRRHAQDYAGCYEALAYPIDYLGTMAEHATAHRLDFGCSLYLPGDAAKVAPFVSHIKLASFEAHTSLRNEVMDAGRHLYLSAGMMSHAELMALVAFRDEWRHFCQLVDILHCVSHYTGWIPYGQRNLAVIRAYGLDGFSDHTRDINGGAQAVLAGARVLEVHMRPADADASHPDYGVALDPVKLGYYVRAAKEAAEMLGDPVKRPQACESDMQRYRAV